MIKNKNSEGFSIVEILLALIVVCILGFTAWFVYHTKQIANKNYADKSVGQVIFPTKKATTQSTSDQQNEPLTPSSTSTTSQATQGSSDSSPNFSFVDTTGWQPRSPTDKSFSVRFDTSQTYGNCSGATGVLLIGMVFMNPSGVYDCSGVENALTPTTNLTLTYIAIGPSENLWDKGNSKSISVTLSGGQAASRYEYTNTISGTNYTTIEYDVTVQGKAYVAVMHWPTATNLSSGSYITPGYFDTIVQKTWAFN